MKYALCFSEGQFLFCEDKGEWNEDFLENVPTFFGVDIFQR